jgi:hypothetical protein
MRLFFLRSLVQFCEQDPRCHRLLLTDLLISPMQHCTKVPLLLNNIRRYTDDPVEQQMLKEALEKLEKSISEWINRLDD